MKNAPTSLKYEAQTPISSIMTRLANYISMNIKVFFAWLLSFETLEITSDTTED